MSTTRKCTKCGQIKPVEEFPWKNSLAGWRHSVCKTCTARRSNRWYQDNKTTHIQNVMQSKRVNRQEARQFIWDYLLSHPCVDCGESDPTVLEFDHISEKKENVSNLVANGANIQRLKMEIDLCEVRCSNCHRKKTSMEWGWFSG